MKSLLEQYYGYLFEKDLLEEIETLGVFKMVKQGEILMDVGQILTHMPLLFEGAIKVLREDKEGNDLLLYFIENGDTCAMTLSCCMGEGKSKIRAVAETDTEMVMIPVEKMDEWLQKYKSWRAFVLENYHSRMMELLETVDTLAFMNLDERLSKYLKDKAMVTHDHIIHTTHSEVAQDLHTSRVVVSRLLKRLEQEGDVRLSRNTIEVLAL